MKPASAHKKKLPNELEVILNALAQYKNGIVAIVVESIYNWYLAR